MLLATMFTIGRMMNFNEIVAVKNSGVSLFRFMLPFLAIGAMVTGITLYFNNWVVPEANKKKFFIERNYLGKSVVREGLTRLYFQDSRNQMILIEQFNEVQMSAAYVSLLVYDEKDRTILLKRIDAPQMLWENGRWRLINAIERDFEGGMEKLTSYPAVFPEDIQGVRKLILKPPDITKKQLKPDELNYGELKDFIESQIKGGHDAARSEVDFYAKISFPFSNMVVILFGMAIATGARKKRNLPMQFGISLLASFIYLAFVKFSQAFGYNGDLNPLLTAWLANIFFAGFGAAVLWWKNY
jgi:lipopolysaccharide export system permease protein